MIIMLNIAVHKYSEFRGEIKLGSFVLEYVVINSLLKSFPLSFHKFFFFWSILFEVWIWKFLSTKALRIFFIILSIGWIKDYFFISVSFHYETMSFSFFEVGKLESDLFPLGSKYVNKCFACNIAITIRKTFLFWKFFDNLMHNFFWALSCVHRYGSNT